MRWERSVEKSFEKIKVIGVGKLGIQVLDRLTMEYNGQVELFVVDTDATCLQFSIVEKKLLIGEQTTEGFGTGGDVNLGVRAIEESIFQIDRILEEGSGVVVVGGLGGGTAGALMVHLAKRCRDSFESRLPFVAITTLPFAFEGDLRVQQAYEDLRKLEEIASAVLVFSNEQLLGPAFSSMNTEDVFRKLEEYLSNILSVLINILGSGGPIELSFSELVAELGSLNGGTFFATSFAQGPNRAFDVVKRLKKCPFFRVGLEDTPIRRAVVHLQGGADLKMNEVAIVFEELQKEFTECSSFKVGISTKGIPEGSLRLTVFGSKKEISTPIAKTVIQTQLNSQDVASLQKTKEVDSFEPQSDQIGYKLMKEEVQQTNFSRQSLFIEGRENLLANGNKGEVHFERNIKMVQSELPLVGEESMSKFCFTEPTLEEGENLDVPTYIRWNIKIR